MKYPQLLRMPSEVSEWLEEQLEQRGIDAIVYTRYVLSLLLYSSNGGSSDQLWTWRDVRSTSAEEAARQRRLAAVDCLVAASDHPHHIESLVDELCDRLERVNSDTDAATETTDAPTPAAHATTTSRQDLARRYYAAFPALQATNQAADAALPQQEKWPLKRHGKEMNLATPPSKHRYTSGAGGGNAARRRDSKRLDYAGAATKKRQMVFQRPPGIDRNWFITSRLEDWHTHNTSSSFTTAPSTDNTANITGDYTINDDTLALDIVRDILDDSNDICGTIQQQFHRCDNLHHLLTTGNAVTAYSNKYITNGTNIIASIWSSSEDDMAMGWTVDHKEEEEEEENAKNDLDDGMIMVDEVDGYLDVGCRWSEAVNYESQMLLVKSLEMLNHSQEFSGFSEVVPKADKCGQSLQGNVALPPPDDLPSSTTPATELDDLLHSAATHFRPITPPARSHAHHTTGHANSAHRRPAQLYADGTTFCVRGTLDTVRYERGADGSTMWLDMGADGGGRVEYMSVVRPEGGQGFELKFRVGSRANEKACQTMSDEEAIGEATGAAEEEFFFPGDLELLMDEEGLEVEEADDEYVRAEDNCIMEELFGKFIETAKCDKCSTNPTAAYLTTPSAPNGGHLKSIWDAGELCVACLRLNAHSSGRGSHITNDPLGPDDSRRKDTNQQQAELRYDVTKDGEQLLSDLSSIQRRYMMDEERISTAQGYYYGTDIRNKVLQVNNKQYDYENDLIGNTADCLHQQQTNNSDHHHPVLHSASFSFASRLQEDCLIKMATMPTLRSVTL